jgi:hypothetical protein
MIPGVVCATCVYFSQYQPYDLDRPLPRGQCRRHAPSLYQGEGGALKTAWPMVHETGWCGEHAQIEIEEPLIAEQRPQPTMAEIEVMIAEPKPAYDGREWRCVNCKTVEAQWAAPERCVVCRCQTFTRVEK